MKTVKDIKVGDVVYTPRNGEIRTCKIRKCKGTDVDGVMKFVGDYENGGAFILLCGLPDSEYLNFGSTLEEAKKPYNDSMFTLTKYRIFTMRE